MSEKFRLFTKILIAELEDLEDDIANWGKYLDEKHHAEKVTEYVFLQNSALLGQELSGVKKLIEAISRESPPEELKYCSDPAYIRDYYAALVRKETEFYEFQKAIAYLVLKKIDKVRDYLSENGR